MLEIRPIAERELDDALPLFAAYQRFYGAEPDDARNREFLRRLLEPSDAGLVLGAWDEGTLLGLACLHWTLNSIDARPGAYLADLYVVEEARGRGVGRALLAACADVARDRGYPELVWETAPDNAAARRLYDAMGAEASTWVTYRLPVRG